MPIYLKTAGRCVKLLKTGLKFMIRRNRTALLAESALETTEQRQKQHFRNVGLMVDNVLV